jgi:GNAT superfamily N-acetyltransferase
VDEPRLTLSDQPDEANVSYVQNQLHSYNVRATGYTDYRPLAVFARDPAGAIIAGLTGFTWGGALKIEYLWVHEAWRSHGLGSRLIDTAECEARARGCQRAVLDTHSFQAPGFYPKLGYTACGVAEDWPVGYSQVCFQKRL